MFIMRLKVWFVLIALVLAATIRPNGAFESSSSRHQTSTEAYVTLLYGDEFLLGVRVLGNSIRDTGSTKDMVALVSDGVSNYAMKLLEADGWIVEKISLLANPNQVRPSRFWGVYTKLKIFNMTNYKKVVYLDADTIVVKNIEDLFKCSKFCANLKHSERLNSGVMVVEPSETVFNDMMRQVSTLPSYTGGDQGFLNSYYSDFPNAHLFEPSLPAEVRKSRPVPAMERLSTLYNADVGLYMLANKWMVNESELRVIHYTLGPLKPWDWWTSWLLKPVDVWQNARVQLKESLPGTGGGRNPNDALLVSFLFLLPFCALLFCYYRSFLQSQEYFGSLCRSSLYDQIKHLYYKIRSAVTLNYTVVSTSSSINPNHQVKSHVSVVSVGLIQFPFTFKLILYKIDYLLHFTKLRGRYKVFVCTYAVKQSFNVMQTKVPVYLGGISIVVCFMAALVALALAFAIVPRQVMPWTGLLMMYEWTFTIFFILFGGYLHLIYQWGKGTAVQAGALSSVPESVDYDSGKGHQRQESLCASATLCYGLGMAFLAIAAPSLPCLFGITALFLRLGLMVVGGLALASFMTYASEHLATRSFLRGFEDRDGTRSRSFCLLC